MKIVKLFHNPDAGDAEHTKDKLVKLLESKGYKCRYTETKNQDWKKLEDDIDIVAIAGGDGTIRKICGAILTQSLQHKMQPIALIPMGTANNIGKSLGLDLETGEFVDLWAKECTKSIDIGNVDAATGDTFFIEALGFGIFPALMKKMKDVEEAETPEENLRIALRVLLNVVKEYEAQECSLVIDGQEHHGKFLLVEVMNMLCLGPNLELNPLADPGDGIFEVVIVTEDQREKFQGYIEKKINGLEAPFSFSVLKGRDILVNWQGRDAHADDELIKAGNPFHVTIDKGVFDIIIP